MESADSRGRRDSESRAQAPAPMLRIDAACRFIEQQLRNLISALLEEFAMLEELYFRVCPLPAGRADLP